MIIDKGCQRDPCINSVLINYKIKINKEVQCSLSMFFLLFLPQKQYSVKIEHKLR